MRKSFFRTVLCFGICLFIISTTAFADTIHYDKLNRISEILYDDGSSIRYVYDANGNITEIEKKASTVKPGEKQDDGGKDDPGEKQNDDGKDDPGEKQDDGGKDDPGEKPEDGGKDDPGEKQDDDGKDDYGEKQDEGEKHDAGKEDSRGTNNESEALRQGNNTQDAGKKNPVSVSLVGRQIESKNAIYRIMTEGKNGTVKLIKLKKKAKSYRIPDTVTYEGDRYLVTEIADQALKGQGKLKKLTIGKNVSIIGKKAFFGCKKLNKITIRSAKLKKIGKRAFTGTGKNLVVKVPKKQKTVYKKLLKNKGMKKTAKIK